MTHTPIHSVVRTARNAAILCASAMLAAPLALAIPPAPPLEPATTTTTTTTTEAPDCTALSVPVFFAPAAADLSEPARAAIDNALSQARGCTVEALTLQARGRDGADAGEAYALREARASAVLAALPVELSARAERRTPAVMSPTLSALTVPDERAVVMTLRLSPARES
jgi:hypothetical protein